MKLTVWNRLCAALGVMLSAISSLFGGFDGALLTLTLFMCTDFLLGLLVAAVFSNSNKTESGKLSSSACFRGLCRKFAVFAAVLIGARLDTLTSQNYIRDAVIYCYLVNEGLSITENMVLMGVPVPEAVKNALDILKGRK